MAGTLKSVTDWLNHFEIEVTSGAERAYDNGNQKIMITLTVAPQTGQTIRTCKGASIKTGIYYLASNISTHDHLLPGTILRAAPESSHSAKNKKHNTV